MFFFQERQAGNPVTRTKGKFYVYITEISVVHVEMLCVLGALCAALACHSVYFDAATGGHQTV